LLITEYFVEQIVYSRLIWDSIKVRRESVKLFKHTGAFNFRCERQGRSFARECIYADGDLVRQKWD
jgi:hypothetical protein